jgi:hypothetical protein
VLGQNFMVADLLLLLMVDRNQRKKNQRPPHIAFKDMPPVIYSSR